MKHQRFLAIIAFVALIVFIGIFSNRTKPPLPAYVENGDETQENEEEVKVNLTPYQDETIGFSLGVPEGWQYVLKDGQATFIHQASASSVQINVLPYNPSVLLESQETSYERITAENGALSNFSWLTNDSYVCSYQKSVNNSAIDYVEYVMFDRSNIVKVIYVIQDSLFTKLQNEISASIDSIVWNRPDPIPEGFNLAYSDFGRFEYGYPVNWNSSVNDGVFYTEEPNGHANFSISCTPSETLYQDISQVEYINWVSQGRSNFNLQNFGADANRITAAATYKNGDTLIVMEQYLFASGEYEYVLTMECPYNLYQDMKWYFETERNLLRFF